MVPDFEYFVRLAPRAGGGHTFSHTLPGLFLIDLPLGMAVYWLYHMYAKASLWAWLPGAIRVRVNLGPSTSPFGSYAQSTLAFTSILIGAALHLLWDSFTHASYWPYSHLDLLSSTIELPFAGDVQIYVLLQKASAVLGSLVLLIWILRQLIRAPINPEIEENSRAQRRRDLIFVSVVAIIGGNLRALHGLRPPDSSHRIEVFILEAGITAITLFFIQSIIFGFLRDKAGSPTQSV